MPHLALWFYGVLATEQFIDGDLVKPAAWALHKLRGPRAELGTEEGRGRGEPWVPDLQPRRGAKGRESTRLFGGQGPRKVAAPLPQPGHVAAERAIEAQVCLRSYPIYYH